MEEIITKEKSKKRFSGVEILKIIAIMLICLSHARQTSASFIDYSVVNFQNVILNVVGYFGQIGNVLFVICSSYFLVDSKKTKSEKVFNILFDSSLISILIFCCMLLTKNEIPSEMYLSQFFPDYFGNMWFIPIYVLFYAIHPLLNGAIEKMNQKGHFTFCFVIFVVYGLLGFFFGYSQGLSQLANFSIVYFIVAYMKKYCKNYCQSKVKNLIGFLIFSLLFVLIASISYIFKTSSFSIDSWYSPIMLPALLCLFNLFNSLKFQNKIVNYAASCSLFVYCIHENILLRRIVRPQYYDFVLSNWHNLYFLWIVLCGVGMFVGAYILAIIYKVTFHKLTNWLAIKFKMLFDIVVNFLFKIFSKQSVVQNGNCQISNCDKIEGAQTEICDNANLKIESNFEKQDDSQNKL